MMKTMKKSLSLLLALAMCLSLLPGMALAEEALPEAPSSDTAEIPTETVSLSVTDSDDPDFIEEGEFVFPENATSPITVGEESVGSDEYEPEGEPSELGGDDALLDFGEDLPYDPEEPVDFDGDGEELELEVDTGDDGSLGGIGGANINVSTRERCLSKVSGLGLPIRFENAPKGAKIKIVVMKDLLHTSNVVTCSLSAISSNGSATLTIRPANVGTGYVVIFLCNKLGIPYDIKQIKVNVSDSHIHWAGYVDDITVRVGATQTLYFYGEGFPGVSEIAVSSGNKDAFTAEPQPASVVSRTPIRITGKKVGSGQFRVDYRAKSTGDVLDVKYVNVTVLPPEIPKVRLSTSYITVEPGQTKTVDLSCTGYSGSHYYRFSSSNAEAYTCGWQGSGTLTVKGNQVGSGTVTVYGIDTKDEDTLLDIRRRVGMVFQNPDNQIVANVVEEDVAFAPENLGVEPGKIRERVDKALKTVGMYDYRLHAPHLLSGGQKQRIAIAGVLAMAPKCIVFDEPTAMLDPGGREDVIRIIRELKENLGVAVVLITHHMEETVHADRLIVMDRGRIVMDGTPEEVFTKVEQVRGYGLDVPETTELLWELNKKGCELPLSALTVDECADALYRELTK